MTISRMIGPRRVFPIGLGCASTTYGSHMDSDGWRRLLNTSWDLGINFYDSAGTYARGHSESMIARHLLPGRRHDIYLATKGGRPLGKTMNLNNGLDSAPDALQRDCEQSLKTLGTDYIDLYYVHRWDQVTPIEETMQGLSKLVLEGKILGIGLSEVSADTIRRAHAIHPITAIQSEYSIWSREPEIAVLKTCRELGIAFVSFAPLGRGYFAAPLDVNSLANTDLRRLLPRFQPKNYQHNLMLLQQLAHMARDYNITTAQLALAWLLQQGNDIIPIPGTNNPLHVIENVQSATVLVTQADCQLLEQLFARERVQGNRYPEDLMVKTNSERFAD